MILTQLIAIATEFYAKGTGKSKALDGEFKIQNSKFKSNLSPLTHYSLLITYYLLVITYRLRSLNNPSMGPTMIPKTNPPA